MFKVMDRNTAIMPAYHHQGPCLRIHQIRGAYQLPLCPPISLVDSDIFGRNYGAVGNQRSHSLRHLHKNPYAASDALVYQGERLDTNCGHGKTNL